MPGSTANGVEEAKNAPVQIKASERILQVVEALQMDGLEPEAQLDASRSPYLKKIAGNPPRGLPSGAKDRLASRQDQLRGHQSPSELEEFLRRRASSGRRTCWNARRNAEMQAWDNLQQDRADNEAQRREIGAKLKELRDENQLDASPQATRRLPRRHDESDLPAEPDGPDPCWTLSTPRSLQLRTKIEDDINTTLPGCRPRSRARGRSPARSTIATRSRSRLADIRSDATTRARYKKSHSSTA